LLASAPSRASRRPPPRRAEPRASRQAWARPRPVPG
jgi:hypothetical protein